MRIQNKIVICLSLLFSFAQVRHKDFLHRFTTFLSSLIIASEIRSLVQSTAFDSSHEWFLSQY